MSAKLPTRSLLVLVGGRYSGVTYQLNRLLEVSEIFRPLVTYTDSPKIESDEEQWFHRVSNRNDFMQTCYGSFLTFYLHGNYTFVVRKKDFIEAANDRHVAVIGMPSMGYQSYVSFETAEQRMREHYADKLNREECGSCNERCYNFRYENYHHSAISLSPENHGVFAQSLVAEFGLSSHEAEECARIARQDSSLPPASSDTNHFMIEIPVRGPRDVSFASSLTNFLSS